ncbi:MAG TPA: nitronate monooxygenase [Mycobacteriales bacterium]|nr:nitronate monooxygenase [Mycobacteriales bacterium]
MRTPICDTLGIEFPLFAFSHCRDAVAAVSRAGGFGVLGALAFSPEQLEMELTWIDDHTDGKPYGVDLVMPSTYIGKGDAQAPTAAQLEAMIPQSHRDFVDGLLEKHGVPKDLKVEEHDVVAAGLGVDLQAGANVDISLAHPKVRLLVNALGPPPKEVVDKAHEHDVLVGALVGSAHHAQKQVDIGVDVIVAQGTEAGGHCGEISTMVLIPDVVDQVGYKTPVLAAGGIGTGRQMAAALALGAQGAWTGSIWLTVAEADTGQIALENMLNATSRDTVRSRAYTGKPARQLRSAWTEAFDDPNGPGTLPMPLQGILHNEAARKFTKAGAKELVGFPVGQIVGRMNRVRPASEVVFDLITECAETLERLGGLASTGE